MKTVSLEVAKQLKEKGFKQTKIHFIYIYQNGKYSLRERTYLQIMPKDWEYIAAPTPDEILDLLPDYAQFDKHSLPFKLKIHKEQEEYQIVYVRHRRIITENLDYQERGRCFADLLADAAAKMWLNLNENNLL